MYHSNPALTKAIFVALGAVCQALAIAFPAYAAPLHTLSGLAGAAFITAPGDLSPKAAERLRASQAPKQIP